LFNIDRGKVEKYDIKKHGIWEIYKDATEKLGIKKFEKAPTINTFLFAWNPDKWKWTTLEQSIEQLENSGKVTERWSCVSHKTIKPGDRAFLVRLGSEPRGIFAAGYVVSEPYLSKHWSGEDKDVYRVLIDFEVLLNPENESILTLDILKTVNLEKQQWTPQSSGISIKPELVEELEAVWFDFLTTQKIRLNPYALSGNEETKTYTEGTGNQIIQTRYERNPHARVACINHYGYSCSVCEFDFEKRFGELGKNFIHVHHLTQVATVGKTYQVDPILDLRPVCPNCHAMLHRQNPPLTIEELKIWLT
jgi:5-methylcytosine-specific restriction protein A